MKILVAILAVGIAYIIYKRFKVVIAQHTHLQDEDLEDYLEGRFAPESNAYQQAVAHLGVCEKCRQRLRDMESKEA